MNSGDVDRFFSKVDAHESACWLWSAGKHPRWGYGNFWLSGKMQGAHRVAYEFFKGPIPAGLLVCHSCDTPACVNPEHLWLGTNADNASDKAKKGRSVRLTGMRNWRYKTGEHCK